MPNTFKQEIAKILIDKTLLAVLIVLFGYFANVYLEKDKSMNSFNLEINKVKIERMSEVWEHVYLLINLEENVRLVESINTFNHTEALEYKLALEILINELLGDNRRKSTDSENKDVVDKLIRDEDGKKEKHMKEIAKLRIEYVSKMKEVIARNRFWLTKQEYDLINFQTS